MSQLHHLSFTAFALGSRLSDGNLWNVLNMISAVSRDTKLTLNYIQLFDINFHNWFYEEEFNT